MADQLTRIEDLPEYIQAYTDSQIALRTAGEDPAAQANAKLAWSEKQRELERKLAQTNEGHRNREAALAAVKAQYLNVPEGMYAAETDPAKMEERAKEFADALAAQVAASNPNPAPTGSGATGQPPTGVGGTGSPPVAWADRQVELAQKMRAGTARPHEVEEFQNAQINMQILPAQEKAKKEAQGAR